MSGIKAQVQVTREDVIKSFIQSELMATNEQRFYLIRYTYLAAHTNARLPYRVSCVRLPNGALSRL